MKLPPVTRYLVLTALLGSLPLTFVRQAYGDGTQAWINHPSDPTYLSGGATVNSARDIVLTNQELTSVNAGRDIVLDGTVVRRNISAGREISGTHCYLYGAASAGLSVRLSNCPSVMQVTAGDYIALKETTVHRNVRAGRGLLLMKSLIEGDASVGDEAEIRTSTIEGTLSATTDHLTLDNSTVTHIRLWMPGSNTLSRGTMTGNGIFSGNGQAFVSVGPGSISNVNGYTIKGSSLKTTLITPDEAIYVNGFKVSGTGPDAYSDYRKSRPGAPLVNGPGWREDGTAQENQTGSKPPSSGPAQVVELVNNSRVTGRIVFEGGAGKVIIRDNSEFFGEVTGGVVEKI